MGTHALLDLLPDADDKVAPPWRIWSTHCWNRQWLNEEKRMGVAPLLEAKMRRQRSQFREEKERYADGSDGTGKNDDDGKGGRRNWADVYSLHA
jgi:hypothetical protein